MLDIKFIKENLDLVKKNNEHRHVKVDIDALIQLDEKKKAIQTKLEELRAQKNQGSKEKPTEETIEQMKKLGEQIKKQEEQLGPVQEAFQALLLQVPNLSHPDSPIGTEQQYRIIETNGTQPDACSVYKDHETIMTDLDLIDFERGAKVTGSKFYFLKNDAVRLNQALLNYGIDIVTKHGYTLMETPDIAKHDVLTGIGFNPRGEEKQIYNIESENLSLIGTAEITVGGYHMNEVLDLSQGPKKYAALSHCFRTEAGAYGRTSKGLYRVHQFTKLELFIFCKPEDSDILHTEILALEKEICDGLGLHYRIIDIPTGDLGGPAYRKFDIEAYMTMQDGFGEITSTSNCTDYQARRLNIKYKNEQGKNEYVHTLNGTAIVLSRFPIAIIEQYQQPDGSVKIPEVLIPYIGKAYITK